MVITATELKSNMGKYLDTAELEDIYVTRKGKVVAKISSPAQDKLAILDKLVGIAEGTNLTLKEARAKRLVRQ